VLLCPRCGRLIALRFPDPHLHSEEADEKEAVMHQPACSCENPLCPGTGEFYVTTVDAGRVGFLLGPYATHADALANVERGNRLAHEADPRAWFYAFGTARWTQPGRRRPSTVFGR